MKTITDHLLILKEIIQLPVASLCFHLQIDPDNIRETYRIFTKRHPRYMLIKHKTVGAALLDLQTCDSSEKYAELIKGKNCGGYHAKRARARGYRFAEIDRNRYIDDIHDINTALAERQGRPMDAHYQEKQGQFESLRHFSYYAILDGQGKMMAYANIGRYGNFAAFSQLIGHRNNDGVMHLLVAEIVERAISEAAVRYIMYDTFFGALPGLQQFKTILGFRPYRAKYSLQ